MQFSKHFAYISELNKEQNLFFFRMDSFGKKIFVYRFWGFNCMFVPIHSLTAHTSSIRASFKNIPADIFGTSLYLTYIIFIIANEHATTSGYLLDSHSLYDATIMFILYDIYFIRYRWYSCIFFFYILLFSNCGSRERLVFDRFRTICREENTNI